MIGKDRSANLSVHRNYERITRLCSAGVIDDVGKASRELLDPLPKRDVRPAGLQEKTVCPAAFHAITS
jgi:hypothetical protein